MRKHIEKDATGAAVQIIIATWQRTGLSITFCGSRPYSAASDEHDDLMRRISTP